MHIPHACDLLTPQIAKQLIGTEASRALRAEPNSHLTQCQYDNYDASINVLVGDDWHQINDYQQKSGEKAVAGVGDEAYLNAEHLRVRKGTRGLEIVATDANDKYSPTLEIKAARLFLPRL